MISGAQVLSFVSLPLAPAEAERHLGIPVIVEIDAQRHQRLTFLLQFGREFSELVGVYEEFAASGGLVVCCMSEFVGRDVEVHEPELAAVDAGIGLVKGCAPISKALDLGAEQHHAALYFFENFVPVGGLPIAAHGMLVEVVLSHKSFFLNDLQTGCCVIVRYRVMVDCNHGRQPCNTNRPWRL